MNRKRTTAIVLAAGQGRRMQSDVAKQYMLLEGRPILYYALKTFQDSFVDEIVLVTGNGEEEYCQKEIVDRYSFSKVSKIVAGGKERYHSVYNGLCAADEPEVCFIHDGARPFVSVEILERTFDSACRDGACVAAVPVTDTIKVADKTGFVTATPDRSSLWSVQTPQVFSFSIVKGAYDLLIKEEDQLLDKGVRITDDAMVVEYFTNHPVRIVEGSYANIKITTPEDLARAQVFLMAKK